MRVLSFMIAISLCSCVSYNSNKKKEAPKITKEMSLKEALANAIEFGSKTLIDVKDLVNERKEWEKAEEYLFNILMVEEKMQGPSLLNTMELYRACQSERSVLVFNKFIKAKPLMKKKLAWQLAAEVPSEQMGRAIENYLTESVKSNELDSVLVPAMALAVASNRLSTSYTILREGLFLIGDLAFAQGMIALNPELATKDFLNYLGKAPIEELRQLNLKSIDVFTCTLILEHFHSYPPQVSEPGIEILFHYTISRNHALADMARSVLEKYLPRHNDVLAIKLSRLPKWMQFAFIERSSKRMTPVIALFLDELKKVTVNKDVAEEISALKL